MFPVGQKSVGQGGQQIVPDVLAGHAGVGDDELPRCFPLGENPVDEVVDFHIRVVENCHFSRRGDFRIEWRIEV